MNAYSDTQQPVVEVTDNFEHSSECWCPECEAQWNEWMFGSGDLYQSDSEDWLENDYNWIIGGC